MDFDRLYIIASIFVLATLPTSMVYGCETLPITQLRNKELASSMNGTRIIQIDKDQLMNGNLLLLTSKALHTFNSTSGTSTVVYEPLYESLQGFAQVNSTAVILSYKTCVRYIFRIPSKATVFQTIGNCNESGVVEGSSNDTHFAAPGKLFFWENISAILIIDGVVNNTIWKLELTTWEVTSLFNSTHLAGISCRSSGCSEIAIASSEGVLYSTDSRSVLHRFTTMPFTNITQIHFLNRTFAIITDKLGVWLVDIDSSVRCSIVRNNTIGAFHSLLNYTDGPLTSLSFIYSQYQISMGPSLFNYTGVFNSSLVEFPLELLPVIIIPIVLTVGTVISAVIAYFWRRKHELPEIFASSESRTHDPPARVIAESGNGSPDNVVHIDPDHSSSQRKRPSKKEIDELADMIELGRTPRREIKRPPPLPESPTTVSNKSSAQRSSGYHSTAPSAKGTKNAAQTFHVYDMPPEDEQPDLSSYVNKSIFEEAKQNKELQSLGDRAATRQRTDANRNGIGCEHSSVGQRLLGSAEFLLPRSGNQHQSKVMYANGYMRDSTQ